MNNLRVDGIALALLIAILVLVLLTYLEVR